MLQMEEAKAEVENKVSILLKFIQNRNKIPKVTKKELVGLVNDLHEQCQLLYSVLHDFGISGSQEKPGSVSSPRSSSDLDYFSSEEIEISTGNERELTARVKELEGEFVSSNQAGRIEDLKTQVSNLKQETDFLRDQNMELAGNVEGKRNEDREHFKGLMTTDEVALFRNQKKELVLELEKKTNEVSEARTRLKRIEEETEEQVKAELKSKITEIDSLKEENQKLNTRIAELDSLQKEGKKKKNIDEIEDKTKKLVKEQEDTIRRLSIEIKDQKKLLKEQKEAIGKFSEDQKLMKRWSFGSKLNTNLLERKMEELAEDFRMKMEDHIRILHRRIHVAEQIHLESKNSFIKTQEENTQTQENRGYSSVYEIKKIKEMMEQGLSGPEMAIKKLEEGEELVTRITRLAKQIDSARKWVREKNKKVKHEVETLEAKLECREAQETLLKEKLSKLEAKLGEEGTGKLSLAKAMRRIKKLEINVKEREVELLSLGEEKREAIRQLCVLVDYNRCRYDDLKTSIFKVALQA